VSDLVTVDSQTVTALGPAAAVLVGAAVRAWVSARKRTRTDRGREISAQMVASRLAEFEERLVRVQTDIQSLTSMMLTCTQLLDAVGSRMLRNALDDSERGRGR